MWLTIAGITLAAIGFSVLAVALQWFEFARKVDGGSENGGLPAPKIEKLVTVRRSRASTISP